jgi:hypothetical protein
MSNGDFGRSVSLFIRGILFSSEFTQISAQISRTGASESLRTL